MGRGLGVWDVPALGVALSYQLSTTRLPARVCSELVLRPRLAPKRPSLDDTHDNGETMNEPIIANDAGPAPLKWRHLGQGSAQGSGRLQNWDSRPETGQFTREKWSRHSDLNRGPAVCEQR